MVDNQSQSIINGHQQRSPGTLWINLKIPKEEEVTQVHNFNDDDENQHNFGFEDGDKGQIQKKICHVCNKGFSSGKALGGHMRIHFQASANKHFISGKKRSNQPNIALYKKRKLEKQEEEDEYLGEVDTLRKKKSINNQPPITCSVCGKNFPSMKSLFGHMRCHPDRDWRGIQPPPNNNMSDSSTASVDLSKAVGGWSVTAKRGHSRSCKPVINYSSEEEQQVHDAVQYLMLLAYGDSLKSRSLTGSVHKQGLVTKELEITNRNSLLSCKTTGTKKRTIEETELRIEGTNNICQMKRIKRKGRKMMKLKDLGSIQDANHQNTVFSTPEEYNEFNIAIQNSAEESKLFVENTNECKNISITNDDKPQLSYSSSQSSSVIRNSTTGVRILDFDLNELPIPEDDDEAAAGNCGCVSDFFNLF